MIALPRKDGVRDSFSPMRNYFYRKLREYLDLYVRLEDRILKIDTKGISESLRFQDNALLVLTTNEAGNSFSSKLEQIREFQPDWVLLKRQHSL